MESLKKMKECLTNKVEAQVYGNLDGVDAKELGEAVDMIKDLAEAIYYCTITESMEKGAEEEKKMGRHQGAMYYSPRRMMQEPWPIEYYDPRYRERYMPTMYAQGGNNGNSGNSNSNGRSSGGNNARGGGSRGYSEGNIMYHDPEYMDYPMPMDHIYRNGMMMRDPYEGKSGQRRKMYMEGKGKHDKTMQMKELESYMQELSEDLTEMIHDASPEEKQLLQQKISTLATKIK